MWNAVTEGAPTNGGTRRDSGKPQNAEPTLKANKVTKRAEPTHKPSKEERNQGTKGTDANTGERT